MKKIIILLTFGLLIFSCSSPKKVEPLPEVVKPVEEAPPKYSDMNNLPAPSDRQYKRMTRERMEEESELGATAGSLWQMEGQNSFLFAENKKRKEGDPTAIKLEGSAMKLMETKVAVVQDLLKELEKQKVEAQKIEEARKLAMTADPEFNKAAQEAGMMSGPGERQPTAVSPNEDPLKKAAAKPEPPKSAEKKEEVVDLKELENIPSRIVERTEDGMYRIHGQQFLTINKRPYKVIATGLVRQEDFDDASISSTKILDAQYDIIHIKKVNNE